ncbi:MAG: hypothetical protein CMN75_05035 [Spirochaeta sp.]|nr:hypothetical protein [Spirochaeta sp.]
MREDSEWKRERMKYIIDVIVVALFLLVSSASIAESSGEDDSGRWIPSLKISSGMLMSSASGSLVSTLQEQGQPEPVIESASGASDFVSPWIGGSLEIMTPVWKPLGGGTRFFLHGGLAGNVGFERDLAKEGSPGPFKFPPLLPLFSSPTLVRGQGSVTRAAPTGFQASAGIGISFTIETDWLPIRIKPSFEYLVEEIEISGLTHRATSLDPAIPSWNLYAVTGSQTRFFHSIGPGLEVEADIFRKGSVLMALTGSGGAYHLIGNRDVEFSSTDPTGSVTGEWAYRKDPWTYRFDLGLRFRWAPITE